MKKLFLFTFVLALAAFAAQAQDTPPADDSSQNLDVQPAITSKVNPVYPKEALSRDLDGTVWVKVLVTEKSVTQKVEILKSTDKVFEQAAIDAAMQFRFTPGYVKSKPVDCWVTIPFKFKLAPKSSMVQENAEKLPKTLKTPTVLVVEGPKSLSKSLSFPREAVEQRIEGAVFVTVTLNNQKRISGLAIAKGIGGGCDEEVLRGISTHKFYEDSKLELTKQGDQSTTSVVIQFILPAK